MSTEKTGIEVQYDDIATLKETLIGHRIVSQRPTVAKGLAGYGHGEGSVEFTLDDGTQLYAIDADGGCACANGCFDVTTSGDLPENVITDVEQTEQVDEGEYDTTIRLFVYTAGLKTELFQSKGGDNGYYGWGHHIVVRKAL